MLKISSEELLNQFVLFGINQVNKNQPELIQGEFHPEFYKAKWSEVVKTLFAKKNELVDLAKQQQHIDADMLNADIIESMYLVKRKFQATYPRKSPAPIYQEQL